MRPSRLLALYRRHFRDHRRERMFLASVSFFFTFGVTRLLVLGFRAHESPFELWIAGVHVHHFVLGIGLLLAVGYLWLIQVGNGTTAESRRLGRVTALLYGTGSAFTLDEFALWLHLEDVYWEPAGRTSFDAVLLFGGLVSAGLWGGAFWRAAWRHLSRVFRRRLHDLAEPQPAATGGSSVNPLLPIRDLAGPVMAEAEPALPETTG